MGCAVPAAIIRPPVQIRQAGLLSSAFSPRRPNSRGGQPATLAPMEASILADAMGPRGGSMDKKAKKAVLQTIPYGAYVVGTKTDEGSDHLMFGTWLMQTSFKPPLVAFAFSEKSRTLAHVRRAKAFAVSFLAEGMGEAAEHVLDEAFDKVRTERTPSGLPVLADGA